MAAEVVIPEGYGLAKLVWSMTGKANPVTSTCGYSAAISTPDDCAEAIYYYATTSGSICDPDVMAGSYTFEGVDVVQNVGGDLVGAHFGGVTGTGGGTSLPPINASLLMSKRTARVGRKFQGRMYLPNTWCGEAAVDAMGNITGAALTEWQGLVDVFAHGITTPSVLPGFLSGTVPYAVILHTDPAVLPTAITSFVARPQMATQRRRMRS